MKLGAANPAPASAELAAATPAEAPTNTNPDTSSDKPFDDEPFDAGVEADEQSDPKTYIEQLSGKLGQSLRKYTEDAGQPDFELEKFAVNSVLSATHTSQMDAEDQKDIINKVKEAGNTNKGEEKASEGDNSDDGEVEDVDVDVDAEIPAEDNVGESKKKDNGFLIEPKKSSIFAPKGSKEYEETIKSKINENGESLNYMFWQNLKTINHASNELLKMNHQQIDEMCANGHAWAVDHISSSTDDIEEVYHFFEANIKDEPKTNNFDKGYLLSKLQETFNQDSNMEPAVEPMVKPAPVKKPEPSKPTIPSRKNKPFLPSPSVQPNPKAIGETNETSVPKEVEKTNIKGMASELASISKNVNDLITKQVNFFAGKKINDAKEISSIIAYAADLIKNR